MLDEDETIKELAMRMIEELWFRGAIAANAQSSTRTRVFASSGLAQDKAQLQSQVVVIMGPTAANFKNRQSSLEDIPHKIVSGKEGAEVTALHAIVRYVRLIDGLVDALDS
jgi:cohesin loading factor subunit SCC2